MDTARTNEIEKHKRTQHYEVLREMGDCYTSVVVRVGATSRFRRTC